MPINSISNKILFENFIKDIMNDILRNYNASGARASGQTERELTGEAFPLRAFIEGVDYLPFEERGRGITRNPGTGEVKKAIRQWIDDKGIPQWRDKKGNPISKDSMAFVIARKIHNEGTFLYRTNQMRDIYSGVITDEKIEDLFDKIGDNYSKEILSDIIPRFQ